jgi:hypothetical protein
MKEEKKFVLFWIPYRYPLFDIRNFSKKELTSINIDDIGDFKIDIIYEPFSGGNGRIIIRDGSKDLVNLEVVYFDRFGFIVCKILYCEKGLEELLLTTFYHLLKEIWHEHEFHSPEEDTILQALILEDYSEDEIKRGIIHYLELYLWKFREYNNLIADKYSKSSVLKTFCELLNLWNFYKLTLEEENRLNLWLGEYLYFRNLKEAINFYDIKNRTFEIRTIDTIAEFLRYRKEDIKYKKDLIINV